MNAKFFDLKKEKQDRMINAALKIFALNGYSHASTDEIVKEAHISKGLLFHYFESKIGVYTFLADYGSKYFALELTGAVDSSEKDYFKVRTMVENAKMMTLKTYPFLLYFINSCKKETVGEAVDAAKERIEEFDNSLKAVYEKTDLSKITETDGAAKLIRMLDYTLDSIMENELRRGTFTPETLNSESVSYINVTASMF